MGRGKGRRLLQRLTYRHGEEGNPATFDFEVSEGSVSFSVKDIEDEFGNPVDFDDLGDFGYNATASTARFYRDGEPGVTFSLADLGIELGTGGTVSFEYPDWPFDPNEGMMKIADIDLNEPGVQIDATLSGDEWEVEETVEFPESVRTYLVDLVTPEPVEAIFMDSHWLHIPMTKPILDQVDIAAFAVEAEGRDFVIDQIDITPVPGEPELLMWVDIWFDTVAGDEMEPFDEITVSYDAAAAGEGQELQGVIFCLLVEDFSEQFTVPPPPPDSDKITVTVDEAESPNKLLAVGEEGAVEPGATVKVYEPAEGDAPPTPYPGSTTAEADGSFTFEQSDDAHEVGNLYVFTQTVDGLESRFSSSITAEAP